MSEIYAETIAVNRNAAEASAPINLYGYNGVERMTVAQLVNAMAVRRCACLEEQSVIHMNLIATDTDSIERVSDIADLVLAGTWGATAAEAEANRAYLVSVGIKEADLPETIDTYARRMQIIEAIRVKLEEFNSSLDRTAVELQTSVSRRDAMYNLATTMCTRAFGSMSEMAVKM